MKRNVWVGKPTHWHTHTHTRLCCHLSAVYTSKRRFRTIMRSLSSSLSWFVLLPLLLVPGSQLGQTGLILKVCPHTYGPSVTWRLQHCNIANYWLNLWKMLSLKKPVEDWWQCSFFFVLLLLSLVLAGSYTCCTLHIVALLHLPWPSVSLCFNSLNRPESLDKQEFSRGVAGFGTEEGWGGNGRFFVVIRGPYVSNLRALCTLA